MYNYFMNQLLNFFLPHPAYAATDSWSNINSNCVSGDVATIQGLNCLFQNIAQVVIYFAGIVFFIFFIKGGFSYLTSGGDPKRIAKAIHTLTFSFFSLAGVILAFLIMKFIKDFTGINVTDVNIPG